MANCANLFYGYVIGWHSTRCALETYGQEMATRAIQRCRQMSYRCILFALWCHADKGLAVVTNCATLGDAGMVHHS